jgi:hypothetical protein
MGSATVILSCYVAYEFFGHHKKMSGSGKQLTKALMWQLVGEAIIGLGTLMFAVAAHTGHLSNIALEFQSLLRFCLFFATALTTWHLYRTIDNMRDHD